MDDKDAEIGKEQTECCMCGDVGFQDCLFRCLKCHHRFQHIYCSRLYNFKKENVKICDWCLDLEAKRKDKMQMQSQGHKRKSEKSGNKEPHHLKHSNANVELGECREKSSEEHQGVVESRRSLRSVPEHSKALGRRYKLLSDVLF